MSFKDLILKKNATLFVPEKYARQVIAKFPTFMTYVTADKGSLIVDGQANPSMEDFATIQEVLKDKSALFFFANYPDDFPEESAQPFVMAGTRESPLILMMLTGAFENYADPKSPQAPAYFAYQKYFKPKFNKWLKGEKGFKVVLEELNDGSTKMDIRNSFQGKGGAVFMFPNGDDVTILSKNNDTFGTYPWGYTTDKMGYVEAAAPPAETKKEEETSTKKTGWFSSSFRKEKKVEETKTEKEEEEVEASAGTTFPAETGSAKSEVSDVDGSQHAGQEDEEAATAGANDAEEDGNETVDIAWKPTINIGMSRAQKQKLYDEQFGIELYRKRSKKQYPEDYKKGTEIKLRIKRSDLQEYIMNGWYLANGMRLPQQQKKEETKPVASTKPAGTNAIKNTMAKHVEPEKEKAYKAFSDSATRESVRAEQADIDKAKEAVGIMLRKKTLDFGSAEIVFDPAKLQSLENEYEPTWKRLGFDGPENIFDFSREGLKTLLRASEETFLDMMEDLRLMAIKSLPITKRPSTPQPGATNKPEPVATSGKGGKNPFRKAS
jgi:hypothetical protein